MSLLISLLMSLLISLLIVTLFTIPTMIYNRRTYAEALSTPSPLYPNIDSYNESQDKEYGL